MKLPSWTGKYSTAIVTILFKLLGKYHNFPQEKLTWETSIEVKNVCDSLIHFDTDHIVINEIRETLLNFLHILFLPFMHSCDLYFPELQAIFSLDDLDFFLLAHCLSTFWQFCLNSFLRCVDSILFFSSEYSRWCFGFRISPRYPDF